MKTAFIYSDNFGSYTYSAGHPMRPVRLKLTFELIKAIGLDTLPSSPNKSIRGQAPALDMRGQAKIIEARKATEKELLLFHSPDYIRVLKEANTGIIPVDGPSHGLGMGDNPVFQGVYDWSCLSAGASLQAAEMVATGQADIAFNIAGGLHHAMPSRASGFCYINDAAVAIKYLAGLGKRVAYVDIDAHHGDGVEYAFYDSDKCLTVSIHENGNWLFPGTGFITDIGVGQGKGFSVNLPLPPETNDAVFVDAFNRIVPCFIEAFKPDVLVTQLGVDTFGTDPITHLNLTTNGFEEMVRRFKSFNIPWVALGGGGYDLSNVARAWTLAWAIMNGIEPPETIPGSLLNKNSDIFRSKFLRDAPLKALPFNEETAALIKNDIDYLLKEVLPMVKSSAGL